MIIHLNTEQANRLLALLDLAVKAGGLQVAASAVWFQAAIQKAATEPESPRVDEPGK